MKMRNKNRRGDLSEKRSGEAPEQAPAETADPVAAPTATIGSEENTPDGSDAGAPDAPSAPNVPPAQNVHDAPLAQNISDAPPAQNAADAKPEVSGAKRLRKPIVSSISRRTTINYILFALIVLVLLWAMFFIGIYGFYGKLVERELADTGRQASSAFPMRIDDNSLEIYKRRLSDIVRNNEPIAAAVFTVDESGNVQVYFIIDDKGRVTDSGTDLFDSMMDNIDFNGVFKSGQILKTSTSFGPYMCYGSGHSVKTGEGEGDKTIAYLLMAAPYEVFNPYTKKLLYTLVICTLGVLGFSALFAYFASRYQTKRLKDFSQKAKRVASGDYDVVFSGGGYDEYDDLATALNAATENIQKTENMQRDIVANVSHDIRTPLTLIRSYAEMLRDMPVDEKKREKTANVIITEADRLTEIINDVLDFSRLQSGVAERKIERCDLSKLAATVAERFDIVRVRDGIDLACEAADAATVECDRQHIERVLYNLINNAINYCGEDKAVIIKVIRGDDKARVEVTDHGAGIEKDELDSVWDRYYRSPHSKRCAAGTGLGLSICKSILTAHEADFGVSSEPGKGSTFWFELPLADKK